MKYPLGSAVRRKKAPRFRLTSQDSVSLVIQTIFRVSRRNSFARPEDAGPGVMNVWKKAAAPKFDEQET